MVVHRSSTELSTKLPGRSSLGEGGKHSWSVLWSFSVQVGSYSLKAIICLMETQARLTDLPVKHRTREACAGVRKRQQIFYSKGH